MKRIKYCFEEIENGSDNDDDGISNGSELEDMVGEIRGVNRLVKTTNPIQTNFIKPKYLSFENM